jgi:DNA modification methylase
MRNTSLTWHTEKRRVADLKAADYNPRKASEQEERDLEESIAEFGTVIPVVVNVGKRANVIIGGHFRVRLYEKKKIEEIDVMVPSRELTIAEEKRLNLRLNKNTGSWDPEKLKGMGLSLLLDVGFDDEDLQIYFDDVDMIDDEFDLGRAMKEIKNPKTKRGDIYQLGDHRLMCGNPLDTVDIDALTKEGKLQASLVHIDTPRTIGETFLEALQDEKTKAGKYAAFVETILDNALEASKPNAHIFTWADEKDIWLVQSLYREMKIEPKRVCMWIQKDLKITAKVAFNKAYEPCIYGTRGKDPFLNPAVKNLSGILNKEVNSGNQMIDDVLDSLTVWTDRQPKGDTAIGKPVTLLERPLKRCTAPGHIVLDLFGGTGTTMIACEQMKRRALVMEADEILCDIIVKRWEEFTNKKAKKVS